VFGGVGVFSISMLGPAADFRVIYAIIVVSIKCHQIVRDGIDDPHSALSAPNNLDAVTAPGERNEFRKSADRAADACRVTDLLQEPVSALLVARALRCDCWRHHRR
jgi:hypothetical protein